jgi:hypothetical protein
MHSPSRTPSNWLLSLAAVALLSWLPATALAVTDRGLRDDGQSFEQSPFPFVTFHNDVMNTGRSQMTLPAPQEFAWKALDRNLRRLRPGAFSAWPLPPHPDGVHIWGTSLRGLGFANLHRVNRFTGEVDFETPPQQIGSHETPSCVAGATMPTVDEQGRVFVMDDRFVWAYDGDGNLLWRTDYQALPALPSNQPVNGPWVGNAIIVPELNLVGSAFGSESGYWLFLDRDTGEVKVWQDFLPTTNAVCPPGADLLGNLIALVVPELCQQIGSLFIQGTLGCGIAISETTSVDPATGLFYQNNGNEDGGMGRISGWRMVENPGGPFPLKMEAVWTFETAPGSATSPVVNQQAGTVLAADGEGAFVSVDRQDGTLRWISAPGNQVLFAPGIDEEGNLIAVDYAHINRFDKDSGATIDVGSYDFLAQQLLPVGPTIPFIVPDGTPVAVNVVTPNIGRTPGAHIANVTFGYAGAPAIAPLLGGPFLPIEKIPGTMLIDEHMQYVDGTLRTYEANDQMSGGTSTGNVQAVQYDGYSNLTRVEGTTLVWSLTFGLVMPPIYRVSPDFGFVGWRPESHCDYARKQLEAIEVWTDEAAALLVPGAPDADLQLAFDTFRPGIPQIGDGVSANLEFAVDDGETSAAEALAAGSEAASAAGALVVAKNLLLGTPSNAEILLAADQLANANASVGDALAAFTCDDGGGECPVPAPRPPACKPGKDPCCQPGPPPCKGKNCK